MPVLLLDDLRSAVADGIQDFYEQYFFQHNNRRDVTLENAELRRCPQSHRFIMHVDEAVFLVDKSLMLTEFIGSWTPSEEELLNTEDMSVKIGSSLKLNEEVGTQKTNQKRDREPVLISDVDEDAPYYLKSLIARPRRFGKTLNLSMLYEFLRMGDTPLNQYLRMLIFKQMEIWKTFPKFCELHFARHPVIFVSFQNLVSTSSVMLCVSLHNYLGELYRSYHYVLDGWADFANFKDVFDQYLSLKPLFDLETATGLELWKASLTSSLANLAKILYAFHGRPCILLLDEFDAPFLSAMKCRCLKDREEMSAILVTILKTVITCRAVGGALVAGRTLLSSFEDLSGIDNVEFFPMYRHANDGKAAFEDFFGFSESEMDEVLSILRMDTRSEAFKLHYIGYVTGSGIRLCSPYSVMSTVADRANQGLLSAWVDPNSSDVFVAEQLVQKYQKWPEILDRIFQLQKAKLGTEEERFRGAIQKFLDIDDLTKSADALWTYLYYAGFLTAIPHKGQGFEHPGNIVVDFFIPNEEVLLAWKIFFDEAMFENGEGSTIRRRSLDVMERLAVGQLDKMARLIKEAWRSFSIWNEPQFADGTGKERDSWYHRLLSMFFSTYVDGHFIVSCLQTGRGEVDVVLLPCPTRDSYYPIVLEFKQLFKGDTPIEKRDEMLACKAKEGCEHADDKKYSEVPTFSPYMKLHQIVVVFCGRGCEVRYRTTERVSRDGQFGDLWLPEKPEAKEPSGTLWRVAKLFPWDTDQNASFPYRPSD